jgi:hypothetical protein
LSAILEQPLLADDLSLLKQMKVAGHLYLQSIVSQYGAEHCIVVGIGVVAAHTSFQKHLVVSQLALSLPL